MSLRLVLALVIGFGATACGRFGFQNGAGDASGAADAGATSVDAAPGVLVDLTAAAPLLATPSPLSSDCGRYLIGWPGYDLDGIQFHATVVGIGDTAYLFVPCKYSDNNGWSMGLATYTPTAIGAQTATWIDGNPGSAGVNEFVAPADLATSGLPIGGQESLALASNGTSLFGLAFSGYNYGSDVVMPIALDAPEDLAATAYDVDHIGVFEIDDNDGTWRGSSTYSRSVLYRDGVYNIFNEQLDAPANDTDYIAVDQATSATDVQLATAPLLTGMSDPVVTGDDNHVDLIVVDDATNAYVMLVADSIADLAIATPQPLGLAQFRGASGTWNYDLFEFTSEGDPQVIGAWVNQGSLYIFYLAGDTDYTVDNAPYSAPRAIGVLREPAP